MDPPASAFVDYYSLLECAQTAELPELKRAYFEKLREFHPDKRPGSATGEGRRVTQALNEAWAVLRDASSREGYNELWHQQQQAQVSTTQAPQTGFSTTTPPAQEEEAARTATDAAAVARAEELRREGNELYKSAMAAARQHKEGDLFGVVVAFERYQAAIDKFSQGLELNPSNHLLHSNRGICYAAIKDWQKCRLDGLRVTMLKPDFMRGWFLLAKSLSMLGFREEALRELDTAFKLLPGNPDLLLLREELDRQVEHCAAASPPCWSPPTWSPPPGSRAPTPPPLNKPQPPHTRSGGSSRRASPEPPHNPPSPDVPVISRETSLDEVPPQQATAASGAPPPLPRKGGPPRMPVQFHRGMQEVRQARKASRSPMDRARSPGTPSPLPERESQTPDKSSAPPSRRPSPELASGGSSSSREPQARSKRAFDGNQSCGPVFFGQAVETSEPDLPRLPGQPDFGCTDRPLPSTRPSSAFRPSTCTRPQPRARPASAFPLANQGERPSSASQRTSWLPEPRRAAVAPSDGKSLRQVILFGARAYQGRDAVN